MGGAEGGPRLSRCPKHSFGGIALTQVPVGVGLPEGSGWGLCVTFLRWGGEKSRHLPRGPPPRPQPGTHLEGLAWQSCPGSAGVLEASASSGAWDPAQLEQVGPIGQDLETKVGVAPGTGARGLAEPALPVLQSHYRPLLLAGGYCRCPVPRGERAGGQVPRLNPAGLSALDLQPSAQLCSGARYPMGPCDHQGGLVTSPQTAQAGQRRPSGNLIPPRTGSSPLWRRPRPAQHARSLLYTCRRLGTQWGGGQGNEVCAPRSEAHG